MALRGACRLARLVRPALLPRLSIWTAPVGAASGVTLPLASASRTIVSAALPRPPLLWVASPLGALVQSAPLALRTTTRLKMGKAPKRRADKPRKQKLKSHHGARRRFKMRADGCTGKWAAST